MTTTKFTVNGFDLDALMGTAQFGTDNWHDTDFVPPVDDNNPDDFLGTQYRIALGIYCFNDIDSYVDDWGYAPIYLTADMLNYLAPRFDAFATRWLSDIIALANANA